MYILDTECAKMSTHTILGVLTFSFRAGDRPRCLLAVRGRRRTAHGVGKYVYTRSHTAHFLRACVFTSANVCEAHEHRHILTSGALPLGGGGGGGWRGLGMVAWHQNHLRHARRGQIFVDRRRRRLRKR